MRRIAPHSLTSRITGAIAILALLAVALFTSFAFLAATKVDEAMLQKQKILVQNSLRTLVAAMPREQESVSYWDDAVVQTRSNNHVWMTDNIAVWLHRLFRHDRGYVIDAAGNLIFAGRGGKAIQPPSFAGDDEPVQEMIRRVREQLAGNVQPNGYMSKRDRIEVVAGDVREIDGRPALVSARPILPHSNRVNVGYGEEYVFVSVRFLDGTVLSQVIPPALVSGLVYHPARVFQPRPESVRVMCQDGNVFGYFTWTPDRPGLTLVKQVAPWGGLALAIGLGVGLYQARGMRRALTELQASEGRARHLAYHDSLTGLPNRALFEQRLDAVLQAVREESTKAAILFLDLDRFKSVNDTLGHRAGDQLMRLAGSRLDRTIGSAGTVARVGGDEFVAVITAHDVTDAAKELSERLLEALAAPFQLGEDVVHVGVSIGVALAPGDATCRNELLRKADIALYEAKKSGRGCYQFFSESMGDIVRQRRTVEADLRKTLAAGDELQLVYQPLYSSAGDLTGAEALIRWNHPVHKSISPMFLITIAEECGLIDQIGEWVLHEACRMVKHVPVPWIAVNVSPVQLRDAAFARRCLGIIAQHEVAPQRIQIEITEAVLIDNPKATSAILRKLRAAGVRVALDDFGTGYSSMSYLQNYPLDRLKIDRFFIRSLAKGEESRAIVAAMIEMARALKLDVTAEGVETAEQREILMQMGCNNMQGYFFSRPVDSNVFMQKFSRSRRTTATRIASA